MNLETILKSNNLASSLPKERVAEIAIQVLEHYQTDKDSRGDWEDRYEKWQDMAGQVMETKDTPWRNAANIKYPLLTQAALQFNARIVPSLMPNNAPVGAGVVGADPDSTKWEIAQKVARHMNYQLTSEMDEWEEQFDSLLMSISISGTEFKKTYFDPHLQRNVSKHLSPINLVVNYFAEDRIEDTRKTEVHNWNKRFIMEQSAADIFVAVDWDKMELPVMDMAMSDSAKERLGLNRPPTGDSSTPYTVLEYHGWFDLDDDGYEEPYIIVVMKESEKVLQIIPRFVETGIVRNYANKIVKIHAYESYTKFIFIPDPDGSFYGIGFGHLLYPLNATINTTINQLLDAGTLNNMSGGFLARGAQLKGGLFKKSPGRWFHVNSTGDDLRKSIVPMPVSEPSTVLYSLMVYMVEAAEKLSATTDIFVGQHPGQNTKAGVTQAVREEGQKVFTAIYKRIRRGLKKELDKIYALNAQILSSPQGAATETARGAQIFEIRPEFYSEQLNIQPTADPNIAVKELKLQKDLTVLRMVQETGIGNLVEAIRRVYKTLEVENIEDILPEDAQPPQPPEPTAEEQATLQIAQGDLKIKETLARIKAGELQLKGDIQDYQVEKDKAEINLKKELEVAKIKLGILQAGNSAEGKDADMEAKVMEAANKVEIKRMEIASKERTGNDNKGGM